MWYGLSASLNFPFFRRRCRNSVSCETVAPSRINTAKLRYWVENKWDSWTRLLNELVQTKLESKRRRTTDAAMAARYAAILQEYPDELATLFLWVRAQSRKKSKTKQRKAEEAIYLNQIFVDGEYARSSTAKEVQTQLENDYGPGDWSRAVEDAARTLRRRSSKK